MTIEDGGGGNRGRGGAQISNHFHHLRIYLGAGLIVSILIFIC